MKITIALDISGSISDNQFTSMKERMVKRFNECINNQYTIILFDHQIAGSFQLSQIQQILDLPRRAGGGTNEQIMLRAVKETHPDEVVICTDGVFYTSDVPTEYKMEIFN